MVFLRRFSIPLAYSWRCITGIIVVLTICAAISRCRDPSASIELNNSESCDIRLRHIHRAIDAFIKDHGDVPSASGTAPGVPVSWRAAILPYAMSSSTKPRYDATEPWDSTNNRLAMAQWGAKLTCPLESNAVGYPTVSYLMLTRKSLDTNGRTLISVLPKDAVIVIESAFCNIAYGEPIDIDIESLFAGDSPFGVGKLCSAHPNVVKALRVDGAIVQISKNAHSKDVRRILEGSPKAAPK